MFGMEEYLSHPDNRIKEFFDTLKRIKERFNYDIIKSDTAITLSTLDYVAHTLARENKYRLLAYVDKFLLYVHRILDNVQRPIPLAMP